MNTFLPLGNDDDTSWSGVGLVAFKLFLMAAMWRGVPVDTIISIVLIGGLVAVVLSIILKVRAVAKTRTGSTASARRLVDPEEEALSASTLASTSIEEEEEALAHLARLERQRHASWSNTND
jgi:hypothetical protein